MPTFLNVSGGDRNLPELGLSVEAGGVVEVDGYAAAALTGHPDFDRVESPNPNGVNVNPSATISEEV